MRWPILFLLCLWPNTACAVPQKTADQVAFEHRLISVEWRLRVTGKPENFCRELYSFSGDATLIIDSGEEILSKNWQVRSVSNSDWIALRLHPLSSNGQPDCQGNITPLRPADTVRYMKDLKDGRVALCWRQAQESCFATLIPLDEELNI